MRVDCVDITKTLTLADMSASITGNQITVDHAAIASYMIVCTGAPVGTLSIQFSNDPIVIIPNNQQAANWVTDTAYNTAVAAAGSFSIKIPDIAFRFVRLIYTRTSGTGNITVCNFLSKGV